MNTYSFPHNVVLLTSSFKKPDRRLFFTKARLFFDRIELSGWELGKRYVQDIRLDQVERIEWSAEASGVIFYLTEGGQIRLTLPEMERWKRSLEQRLHWSGPGSYPTTSATSSTLRRDLSLQELITYTTCMG
ncbi:MAG: hypothetical protein ACE5G0_20710 [Rhodothermales bacterium]